MWQRGGRAGPGQRQDRHRHQVRGHPGSRTAHLYSGCFGRSKVHEHGIARDTKRFGDLAHASPFRGNSGRAPAWPVVVPILRPRYLPRFLATEMPAACRSRLVSCSICAMPSRTAASIFPTVPLKPICCVTETTRNPLSHHSDDLRKVRDEVLGLYAVDAGRLAWGAWGSHSASCGASRRLRQGFEPLFDLHNGGQFAEGSPPKYAVLGVK